MLGGGGKTFRFLGHARGKYKLKSKWKEEGEKMTTKLRRLCHKDSRKKRILKKKEGKTADD
jgi:hypothetical protein